MSTILDVLSTLGNVLDTPRAVAWQAAKGGSVLDVVNPFDEEAVAKRPTGWDLRAWLADTTGAEWLRNKEGFDLLDIPTALSEVVLDPLNAFAGLKAFKTASTAKELRPVAQAARESNLLREAGLAKGFMPEEVAEKTLVRGVGNTIPFDDLGKNVSPETPTRVYHGTADVFDAPSEAAAAERAYHRADEYSRHPPLHFTTPDPELASQYAVTAAGEMAKNSDVVKDIGRFIRAESKKLDETKHRYLRDAVGLPNDWAGWDAAQRARDEAQSFLARFTKDPGGILGLDRAAITDIPQELVDAIPAFRTGAGLPAENVRMYYADVRNPIADDAWTALVRKHGWTENLNERSAGAAQRALEEAKAMGHDALVSSPIFPASENVMYGHTLLPAEIAPFSTSQLYAPYIAPALRDIPNLPSNKRLAALLALMNAERQGKNLSPTLPIEEVM